MRNIDPDSEENQKAARENAAYVKMLQKLPAHLQDDASYLVCSECGRKSWGGDAVNSNCSMPQPSGEKCSGVMEGQ